MQRAKRAQQSAEDTLKSQTEKYSQFKAVTSKELIDAKKVAVQKERTVKRLQQNLKKADSIAQEKISQLRGIQKKAKEDKDKATKIEKSEEKKAGVSVD